MPRSFFERRRAGHGTVATLGVLMSLGGIAVSPVPAAGLSGSLEVKQYEKAEFTRDGVMTATQVVIAHGEDTRITASNARHTKSGETGELSLTGKVHIEFRGALLDADSAVLKFRGQGNNDLVSVAVKGSQAQFSHQPEGFSRRVFGRADTIDFDAASGEVTFSGNTSFNTIRGDSMTSGLIHYNIDTGIVRDDGDPKTRGKATIQLGDGPDRVPPPRQPDRSTAQ